MRNKLKDEGNRKTYNQIERKKMFREECDVEKAISS